MPIKIKNNVTSEIKIIEVQEKANYASNIWTEVAKKNLIELYERSPTTEKGRFNRGRHERKNVENILKNNPTYLLSEIPDSPDWNQYIIKNDTVNHETLQKPSIVNHSHFDSAFSKEKQNPTILKKGSIKLTLSRKWTLQDWGAAFTIIAAIFAILTFIIGYVIPFLKSVT